MAPPRPALAHGEATIGPAGGARDGGRRVPRLLAWIARNPLLTLAIAVWSLPTLVRLAQQAWTTDQGAQGPIVLSTGVWLLAHEWSRGALRPAPAPAPLVRAAPLLSLAALLYVPARILNVLALEYLAMFGGLVALLYAVAGSGMVRALRFPLVYLLFLTPPPFALMFPITRALRLWIADAAVALLAAGGLDVAASGSMLYIDQYELLVETACSGMNSLVGLLAVGLLYVYLRHRGDWRYALLLALLIVPLAIGANLCRVVLLLVMVHVAGAAVLESPLHLATGLAMVGVVMVLLVLLDAALAPVRRRLGRAG